MSMRIANNVTDTDLTARAEQWLGVNGVPDSVAETVSQPRETPANVAQVPSPYIGETEKNLGRVLARAEHADATLLFDEGDALFGKRSDVHDAHDRYANVTLDVPLAAGDRHALLAAQTGGTATDGSSNAPERARDQTLPHWPR
jgi:hypothetical protein